MAVVWCISFRLLSLGNLEPELDFILPSEYTHFLGSLSDCFDVKMLVLIQFKGKHRCFLSGLSVSLCECKQLLSPSRGGSWGGSKQAASLGEGSATAYTTALLEK